MKAWFVVSALILAGGVACGQAGNSLRLGFQLSRIVLVSGDTLAGPVAVGFGVDLLYLAQPNGSIRVFAPIEVAAFAVQQELANPTLARVHSANAPDPSQVRLFRSFYWSQNRANNRPEAAFFEQLSTGPVLLLRRQSLVNRVAQLEGVGGMNGTAGTVTPGVFGTTGGAGGVGRGLAPPPPPTRYGTLTEIRDTYYLATCTGEIQPLRAPKKELLAAFPQCSKQIEAYARQHQRNYSNPHDLADLISYGNSLASLVQP